MGLSEANQQKIWVLAQKVLYESAELDKLLSNMQILSNVYKFHSEEDDDDGMFEKLEFMIQRIKDFRLHKTIRKQVIIQELKCDIDDLVSEMVKGIDAKVMLEFNIYEPNNSM